VVELRPIATGDAERLFEWRNLPEVRRYMFTDRPIPREEHDRWFKSVLVDASRRDWIIQADGVPAGLISLTSIDEHNGVAPGASTSHLKHCEAGV
jgi:UDP-4-amino-4,6-dideoxy-N-acetyl-beta-L-altrosamine N-acetyltransferase